MIFLLTSVFFSLYLFATVEAMIKCDQGKLIDTECQKITDCHDIVEEFLKLQLNTSAVRYSFFMNKTCGFDGTIPKVCCRKSNKLDISLVSSSFSSADDSAHCGNILWTKNLSPDGTPTDLEEFTWLALLEYATPAGRKLGCGGVLISDRHVLTAAQCLDPIYNLTAVHLGQHNISSSDNCKTDGPNSTYCSDKPIVVGIKKMIPHENYSFFRGPFDFDPVSNDVALLELERSVTTNHIKSICLPNEASDGKYLLAGWGAKPYADSLQSIIKLMSRSKSVDKKVCEGIYHHVLQNDLICALPKSKQVACIGDFGGPLMGFDGYGKMAVYGIHSPVNPIPCFKTGVPNTYVDVRRHRKWIISHMND